ncbi:helix-turn-helix domain-containing protein [Microbacterium excoecariae]|uniref:helix-turn-helix domain-containing protein n=1 Tax=Microbacterium excoecariae TaxID=2715210 RepID=UPI00140DF576|nr:helix-turn-helix domain-containing protein [Microbacterium excoecariae]NHI16831.1 helix-turn-helix domain-containing protein [Microbacterium excoecariae]
MTRTISPFSTRTIGAIKAELARRGHDGLDLVPVLGLSRNAVYSRLRGEKSFTLDELAAIARWLGMEPEHLTARPNQAAA